LTRMNKCVNIDIMSIEERTEKYTARRSAELRGEVQKPFFNDERTENYIAQRLSELRAGTVVYKSDDQHPYITKRLKELREGT